MSTTLYRKYRPTTFENVLGQTLIVKTITNALKNNRAGQAYLFTGPRGTGKTTLARLLAKSITCLNRKTGSAEPCLTCLHCTVMQEHRSLDVIEIDAASNTGVDAIRELLDAVKLLPSQGKYKVYIIDEVHMLSTSAFNALLKTLEEPPQHVVFILATTNIHKVPDTIISRCQRFDFSRIDTDTIVNKLKDIAQNENIAVETPALEMIALAANGGLRDAESLLAQVISLEDAHITAEEVSSILGITDYRTIDRFLQSLLAYDIDTALSLIDAITHTGNDPYIFADSLLHTLRQMLLQSIKNKHTNTPCILELIDLFSAARQQIRSASIPQLPLETASVSFILSHETATPSLPPVNHASVTQPTTPILPPIETPPTPDIPTNTSPSTPSSFDFSAVQKAWPDVVQHIRTSHSSLAMTLGNARPLASEGANISLSVRFPIYKEKLDDSENKLTIERAFDRILGAKVTIKILVETSSKEALLADAVTILGGSLVA